jgi:hypothetical protein
MLMKPTVVCSLTAESLRREEIALAPAGTERLDRRAALTLFTAGITAAALAQPGLGFAAVKRALPFLATPDQVAAEASLRHLLKDSELKRLQRQLRAELAASPRARLPDAAATLDNAIAQWTNSLLLKEIVSYRAEPAILWGTDDTPRTWLGYTLGGVGTSGDNPDAIYRSTAVDGDGRYEILGRFDLANRPAQLVIEAGRGSLAQPAQMMGGGAKPVDPTIVVMTDRDLAVAADGSFRISIGGEVDGPNHIATPPGPVSVGFRDMLSDWNQRACQLTIRRLDRAAPVHFSAAELRRRVLADLPGYVRFWSAFPDSWMGGLKPNTVGGLTGRTGGWGFVAGLRFQLAPDEAILVTAGTGDARYTGFQVINPWMIAPDARSNQVCLNLSQATPNADGSYTYVIAPTDPGVANWLDTAGLRAGYAIVRWQALPTGAAKDGLLREFRIVRMQDVANMADLPLVSAHERQVRIAARAVSYNSRTR